MLDLARLCLGVRTVAVLLVVTLAPASCSLRTDMSKPVSPEFLLALVPEELRLQPPNPQEEDAYREFAKAAALIQHTRSRETEALLRSDTPREQVVRVKKLLNDNEQGLAALEAAAQKPAWVRPGRLDSDTLLPELAKTRAAIQLFTLKARLACSEGNGDEAVRALVAASAIANRLVRSKTSMIHYLHGLTCQNDAHRTLRELVWHPTMNEDHVQSLLAKLPPSTQGTALADTLRAELNGFMLPALAKATWPPAAGPEDTALIEDEPVELVAILQNHGRPFDREATARHLVTMMEALVKRTNRSWNERVNFEDLQEQVLGPLSAMFDSYTGQTRSGLDATVLLKAENPWGKYLVYVTMPSPEGLRNGDFRSRVDYDATLVALRNRLYALEHGRPARSLDELGLDLRDPITGEPYRYDPERSLLWSVGEDGVDDGGTDRPDRGGTTDWIFANVAGPASR